jgi:hypothetical protein
MLGDIINDMAFSSIGDVNLVLTFVIVYISKPSQKPSFEVFTRRSKMTI